MNNIKVLKKGLIKFDAWMHILVEIDSTRPLNAVADELGITYSHVHKIMKELVEQGLITVDRDRKRLVLHHTERGLILKRDFKNAMLTTQGIVPFNSYIYNDVDESMKGVFNDE